MEKRVFYLSHSEARRRCTEVISEAPDGYRVVIEPPKRTLEQNDMFHALCSALERSGQEWFGKRRSKGEWKVLVVSGHAVATKEGADVVPGLEGELVNLRESTATMSIARGSSLIEYAQAFCAKHGVKIGEQ